MGKYDKLRRGLAARPLPITRTISKNVPEQDLLPLESAVVAYVNEAELRTAAFLAAERESEPALIPPYTQYTVSQLMAAGIYRDELAEGLALKDEGQEHALTGAASWAERADKWISDLHDGDLLTSDDLIESVGLPNPDATGSNKNNAVGSIFSSCSKRKMIRKIGHYVSSTRKSNHGAVIAIWKRTNLS